MPSVRELADICIPMVDEVAYTPKKLRVIVIGAGFSGLIFAHKYQYEQPDLKDIFDLTILEANTDIGGTWRVNTYPGVQCDVPAHVYAFPFDPNPNWSQLYADGDEILEYMVKTVDKWDLRKHIQFNTRVLALDWQDEEGKWKIKVDVKGEQRDEFADVGHKVHSAEWDHSYDYSGKRIGVIGNGSSGIQILPQMAQLPNTQVVSFQRGPTWITPSLGETLGAGQKDEKSDKNSEESSDTIDEPSTKNSSASFNPKYSERDIQDFHDPNRHHEYRKMLQNGMNKGFRLFRKESPQNIAISNKTIENMRKTLKYNEELCNKLIPEWTLGCRRLTPGQGYLEAFLQPNVSLDTSNITKITPTGLETESAQYTLDVIVCATGFDVSNIPPFPVTGLQGHTLASKWSPEPESYLSLACADMPNFFIFTGPNATVGHGTLITSMTWSAEWMVKWLRKMAREQIKSVAPKQSAVDEFVRYGDEIHKTLTWTAGCRSWYKNHRRDGRVTATWPGSALLYREMIQELRPEDFEIQYWSRNRFRFMGNGFTALEMDENADLAFYLKK